MEPVAVSWLIASSSSPLVAVLALWTIYVFHTYRRRWRTVDLFLLAVCSQELVISVFTFCYAIISLINPPFRTPCNFTQWGLIATRTFQIGTLTSMVVDRSLTVRWPYRYRFSVRRNQIRYHIAVLALVSVLVGVAAIFAKASHHNREVLKHCFLHPVQWDVKYMVFLLSLYGLLLLVSLVCTVQVEIHRNRNRTATKLENAGSFQLPECASPELPSANGMNSPLDTQSSTGSTRALHRPSRQASRRPYGKNTKSTSDLRWPPVALTTLLCFSLNHIPYMVLMSMATWSPHLWSPWHEAILAWLRLVEGILVPLLLFCKDHALRNALRRTFQRRSGALSPLVGDDGPFQMYFDKDHFRKRGTFGSVTPIGIITNYRRTPGKKRGSRKNGGKYTLPGLQSGDSVLAKSCFSAGFLGGEPLSKLSCADLTSLEMWREEDEENFYATLSDDFSTFSCRSADDSALSDDIRMSEELYGGSFTTIANDDFEFHDTRPCGGEVKMRPALGMSSPAHADGFDGFSGNLSFRDHLQQKMERSSNICYDKARDLFDFVDPPEEGVHKPNIFVAPLPPPPTESTKQKCENPITELIPKEPNKFGTLSRNQKATSYSMNDLDLIHNGPSSNLYEEATFVLPVKSESTMSLYRLNVERDLDQLLAPSRSETNVNGDSGFGSGAQSSNPVWSGFLCRKPSDPFWNMRKPTTSQSGNVLHPRMRKIPWISAWKKLDENRESGTGSRVVPKQEALGGGVNCGWKDNVVYGDSKNNVYIRGKIEEELSSDLSTPVCDYNLDIFAKESGVLLENAYGKIVRDDCGVQVNFYGDKENCSPYQGKDSSFDSTENIPGCDVDSRVRHFSDQKENYYHPLKSFCIEDNKKENNNSKDVIYNARAQAVENLFCGGPSNGNGNDVFACELRLNGGHYENMFGTKENIFARCDQYADRGKLLQGGNLDLGPIPPVRLNRKSSGNLGRRDSGRFKRPSNPLLGSETAAIYGQLVKVERRDSSSRRNDDVIVDTKEMNVDLGRRDSTRNKKCGVNRRQSKGKDEKKAVAVERRESKERRESAVESVDHCKNRIEVDSRETDHGKNNLSRRDSQNRNARQEVKNNLGHTRKSSSGERYGNVNIEQNGNSQMGDYQEDVYGDRQIRLERKTSQNRKQLNEEKANRAEEDVLLRKNYRRDLKENIKVTGEVKNEGLWVNAEPFVAQNLNEIHGEYDAVQRESRKDIYDLQRSAREVNVPVKSDLIRKESKTKAERPKNNVKRKTSANRGKKLNSETPEGVIYGELPRGIKRKESGSREKSEDRVKWNNNNHYQDSGELKNEDLENFIKYRDKCEGNFSHIQNLNRETSSERENSRMENLIYGGKSNVEIFPFETYQEPKRPAQFANRTVFDVNENNCRQKKLAITDFL